MSVCLSFCLSVVNFNIRSNFEPYKTETSYLACILDNDVLSNDTKVNYLVTLTLTFFSFYVYFNVYSVRRFGRSLPIVVNRL